MKFKLKDNALKYLNKKSINKIFINPDIETKKDCCGLATMDFNISTKTLCWKWNKYNWAIIKSNINNKNFRKYLTWKILII